MSQKITLGMYYTSYGTTSVNIPDNISKENIPEYLKSHIDDIPLPKNAEYVCDSADIDTENITIEK